MEPGLIWILLGLVAMAAELVLPGVYMIWAGTAAIGTGLVILAGDPGFAWTSAIFLTLLAAGVGLSLAMRRRSGAAGRKLNTPEAGLTGRQVTLMQAQDGALRVRLGDSEWAARLPRGVSLPVTGTAMRVEAVDGTVLIVRPIAASPSTDGQAA